MRSWRSLTSIVPLQTFGTATKVFYASSEFKEKEKENADFLNSLKQYLDERPVSLENMVSDPRRNDLHSRSPLEDVTSGMYVPLFQIENPSLRIPPEDLRLPERVIYSRLRLCKAPPVRYARTSSKSCQLPRIWGL